MKTPIQAGKRWTCPKWAHQVHAAQFQQALSSRVTFPIGVLTNPFLPAGAGREIRPKPNRIDKEMTTKILEIRDEGTTIAALAIKMLPDNPTQAFYFDRCGFPKDGSSITVMTLYDQLATNDPYQWPERGMGMRTMGTAHNHILNHFDELKDGDVIDVQVILGETKTPKRSERFPVVVPSRGVGAGDYGVE